MKRLHVHVSVKDLPASIRFYRTLFGAEPAVTQPDYAKWMLEDPRVNFAISMNRQPVGVNHLGFQVETDEELRGMRAQLEAADARMVEENEQPCCYAKSDKYWVTDPTGIAWETFHTLGRIPVYGEDTAVFNHGESSHAGRSAGRRMLRSRAASASLPVAAQNDRRADLQRPFFMHRQLGAQHLGRVAAESSGAKASSEALAPGASRKVRCIRWRSSCLKRMNLPSEGLRSKSWDEFAAPGAPPIDFIFTVCDNAAGEVCPIWPGKPMTAHWGIADPAAAEGTDADKAFAFRKALKELETRIKLFVAAADRILGSDDAARETARDRTTAARDGSLRSCFAVSPRKAWARCCSRQR